MRVQKKGRSKEKNTARTVFRFHFRHAFPPVVRRFRVCRFSGGASVAVEGEVVSAFCFRFSDALDSAGVLVVAPDDTVGDVTTVEDDEVVACCCVGIVLCCF